MNQTREVITVKNKPALCFVFFKDYFSTRSDPQSIVQLYKQLYQHKVPELLMVILVPQANVCIPSSPHCMAAVEQDLRPNNTEGTWLPLLATMEGLSSETKWGHTDVYPTAKAWLLSSLKLLLVQNYMSFLQPARWNKHKNMTNQVINENEQLWGKFWNKTLPEIA